MRRLRSALCLVIASVAVLVAATPASAAEGVTVVREEALTPRLREIVVRSSALEGETPLRVLLPGGYDPQTPDPYPVLYLLHGAGDDYTSWTRRIDLEATVGAFPALIVMPDGGRYGWYSNWYNNGAFGPPRWADYHLAELIPWVEKTYRVRTDRQGRAVAGLSMGGFGAMSYAARHPDLFASASSFSGAVDSNALDPAAPIGADLRTVAEEQSPPGSVWGQRATEEVRWRGHNPWDLAENLSTLRLTLRTGNGIPGGEFNSRPDLVEVYVHQQSVNLHDRLTGLGKGHVWDDYGPGSHEWTYFQRSLVRTLPDILDEFAQKPAVANPAFTYKSIQPEYSVYGWRVVLDRPVLEFSTLAVRPGRFALTGSGRAIVTTPDGQRFELDLGPAHPFQQYTPPADAQEAVLGADYFKTVEVEYTPPPRSGRDSGTTAVPGSRPERGERGGQGARLPASGATSLSGLAVLGAALAARSGRRRLRRG